MNIKSISERFALIRSVLASIIVCTLAGITVEARAEVILDVELDTDGITRILKGASGVDVEGVLYDVEFLGGYITGSCSSVFGGCDNPTEDFAFQDQVSAEKAAQALLDQVLIDGPLGQFDTGLGLNNTGDCINTFSCWVMIPFGIGPSGNVDIAQAVNSNEDPSTFPPNDMVITALDFYSPSYTNFPSDVTMARFTQVVPIPTALWLFGSGLIGLIGVARRKKS